MLLPCVPFHRVVPLHPWNGTQGSNISKHLRQRHTGFNHAGTSFGFHTLYLTTTLVAVTNNVTHILFGSYYFQLHNGLKQYRLRFTTSRLERLTRTNLTRKPIGVNREERAIQQFHFQVFNGKSSQNTILHSVFETFFYRWNVFLRHITTLHQVNKLQARLSFVNGTNFNNDVGKFTTTTSLLLKHLTVFYSSANGFLVIYLRTSLVTLYFELALQTIDNLLQVQLTHTADYSLTSLFVGLNTEGGIFLSQLGQTSTQLVDVLLALGLHGYTNHGIGEFHRFQSDGMLLVAQGISGTQVFETNTGTNISGRNAVNRHLLV